MIVIQVREKSGKTNYLAIISFSLTIGMVVRKVVALIVVSGCELYALHCEIARKMCTTFPLGSVLSLLLFINM